MERVFGKYSKEARDLYIGEHIKVLKECPDALLFSRYVRKRIPFVVKGGAKDFDAYKLWMTNDSFKDRLRGSKVHVAVVPDGFADAIKRTSEGAVFALPYEEEMLFEEAIDIIAKQNILEQTDGPVYYVQSQNNNMSSLPLLYRDVPKEIAWASKCFDQKPDAVNIWVGSSKSVTSLHKDNYENVFCVLRGKKIFHLYTPLDAPFMKYEDYPVAVYDKDLNLRRAEGQQTRWCSLRDDIKTSEAPKPLVVEVEAGDILYLPSLYFHEVHQVEDNEGLCVAVNYWYDMDYGESWCFMNSLLEISDAHFKGSLNH